MFVLSVKIPPFEEKKKRQSIEKEKASRVDSCLKN